ncbi:MAG: hypothetical protein RBR87_03605 [Bacteroidales bacterium]|nr:hypothetical protein [Bacteroidales bacterium]
MKRILIIAGGILVFLAVTPIIQYVFESSSASDYGSGHIWGNVLLLLLGSWLLYKGIKRKRKPNSEDY